MGDDLCALMDNRVYSQESADALLASLSTGSVPDNAKHTIRQMLLPDDQQPVSQTQPCTPCIAEHIATGAHLGLSQMSWWIPQGPLWT